MIGCDRPAHFCTIGPVGALSRAFEERAPLLRTSKNAPCRTEPVFDILDFGLKSDASAAAGQLKAQLAGKKQHRRLHTVQTGSCGQTRDTWHGCRDLCSSAARARTCHGDLVVLHWFQLATVGRGLSRGARTAAVEGNTPDLL